MERIREIANAVLYEGYLLYPYRHSAMKNRQRWNFGVVYPRAYAEANGGAEPWGMRTECLITGQQDTLVDATVRFLHLFKRWSTRTEPAETRGATGWGPDAWEEGVEREISLTALTLGELVARPHERAFAFPVSHTVEPSGERADEQVMRDQEAVSGAVIVAAERVPSADGAFRLTISIENTSEIANEPTVGYNASLLSSFVSTHTILQTQSGAFVSLMDPPDALRIAAGSCRNEGTYPVLVGDEGETSALLSSPIILYDYPRIAPESSGSLFDGTEIDEILTLRILALTDEEKAEMRQGDERARAILDRTESLTAEQLMKLHGVIRSMGPAAEGGGA